MNHAAVAPWRVAAGLSRAFWRLPLNPFAGTSIGRSMEASLEVFERATRRYGKPAFGITETTVAGEPVAGRPSASSGTSRSAISCISPRRQVPARSRPLLIVAPMSGHYATLLRGTVEAMLPHADVYITDWVDAREVPVFQGSFDLDDYIDYVIEMLRHLGPRHPCHGRVPAFRAGACRGIDPLRAERSGRRPPP